MSVEDVPAVVNMKKLKKVIDCTQVRDRVVRRFGEESKFKNNQHVLRISVARPVG